MQSAKIRSPAPRLTLAWNRSSSDSRDVETHPKPQRPTRWGLGDDLRSRASPQDVRSSWHLGCRKTSRANKRAQFSPSSGRPQMCRRQRRGEGPQTNAEPVRCVLYFRRAPVRTIQRMNFEHVRAGRARLSECSVHRHHAFLAHLDPPSDGDRTSASAARRPRAPLPVAVAVIGDLGDAQRKELGAVGGAVPSTAARRPAVGARWGMRAPRSRGWPAAARRR